MPCIGWAEAPIKIARMTLTIKLDGNWNSFQLANNTPPLSVTGSVIAPSARIIPMHPFIKHMPRAGVRCYFLRVSSHQHANAVALPPHCFCNGNLWRTVSQYILNAMSRVLFNYSWEPRSSRKNSGSHIDASLSRQPLVKGERLVRYEVNAVMPPSGGDIAYPAK